MVYPFNRCEVDVAMIGNHDLDFGVLQMEDLISLTTPCAPSSSLKRNDSYLKHKTEGLKCQWIVSNLIEKGEPEFGVGNLPRTCVIERCGFKIGFIGIIEKDWVHTFKNMDVELEYLNYKRTAAELAKKLKADGCHFVFALAHMRLHHD